jgi:hypothetical protein
MTCNRLNVFISGEDVVISFDLHTLQYKKRKVRSISLERINSQVYDLVKCGEYKCYPFLGGTLGYQVLHK